MEVNFEIIRTEYITVLKGAFLGNKISLLQEKFNSFNAAEHDLKAPLDQAFRDVMLEVLKDNNVEQLQKYVSFCIESCRIGMTTPTMPVVLLGDIFDALTLNKCEDMFTFVEKGVHIWREELFFTSCKNNLLRMCNDLLRRLSRTQNTVFCGRILLFLAKFFPFSERSGLNIVSEFNLENITEYGADTPSSLSETLAELDKSSEDKKLTIDFNLYCKFWALQDFFRNPNQCYNKMQWKTFAAHATNVLSAFSSCKLEELQQKRAKVDAGDVKMITNQDEQTYFAKFLTNQKLLELQLSDANFRRCILLQFLILFQYLNSTVKFKSESYELKPEQVEWVNKMTTNVYNLLEETPPDGVKFAKIVQHILSREEHWNTWKNDGCPEFKKPAAVVDTEEPTEKRKVLRPKRKRMLGDIIKEANLNKKYYMGNNELTKLWNLCPDNLEACKAKDRDFLPSLETYFAESIDQLDPVAMVEDSYKKVNDGNFGWRALRLLARRSPQFFTYSNNHIGKLPEYLEIMIKKIAKEKQDRSGNSQDQQQADGEMEEEILKGADEEQTANDEALHSEEFSPQNQEEKLHLSIQPQQLETLCEKISENWKKLAIKLGVTNEDIQFFETEFDTSNLQARNMIQNWFENDEDASLENLCYILEGLSMIDASDWLKSEFLSSS